MKKVYNNIVLVDQKIAITTQLRFENEEFMEATLA
jgi:hypothetical protein